MKTIIIGGTAVGMGSATRLKKNNPNDQVVVYQKVSYVSFGACGLPYFLSDNFQDENNMLARTVEQIKNEGIELHINSTVTAVDFDKKIITIQKNGKIIEDNYDELIIGVGAKPIIPNIPGTKSKNVFTLTTLEDGLAIKKNIKNGSLKKAAIIGAGFIGLETAEALVQLEKEVVLIEMANRVSPNAFDEEISREIEKELIKNNVDLKLNSQLVEIIEKDEKVVGIKLADGTMIEVDTVILSVGFTPNTDFLKNSKLELTSKGAIIVDNKFATNIPSVWAGGDCATSKNFLTGESIYSPLATIARKVPKIIVDNIYGKKSEFYGSIQTAIVRVFNKSIARTGLTELEIKAKGIDYSVSYITDKDRTNYVKNQQELILKMIMNNKTREIIGAQIIGAEDAIIRIDAIISMIWSKAKVDLFLEQIDLPYAPPFSRPVDIIHIALSKLNKNLKGNK